jgi:hypothetical protein
MRVHDAVVVHCRKQLVDEVEVGGRVSRVIL